MPFPPVFHVVKNRKNQDDEQAGSRVSDPDNSFLISPVFL